MSVSLMQHHMACHRLVGPNFRSAPGRITVVELKSADLVTCGAGRRGGWTGADTYTLQVIRYCTLYATTYRLRCAGDRLYVESEQNVTLGGERIAKFVGTAAPVLSGTAREQ